MKNSKSATNICRGVLWITGLVILLLFVAIWYWVVVYDTDNKIVISTALEKTVYFEDHTANAVNDSWESVIRLSENEDDVINVTGMTCACKMVNNNKHNIKDWTLRIDIVEECYLNSFWCGSVEVHQFRDGVEQVNLLESSKLDVATFELDANEYSDTAMIHLMKGDYFVYIPSTDVKEDVVKKNNSVGIGFIFYYQEKLDLTNWVITYKNDLQVTELFQFKLAVFATILWFCGLILCLSYFAMSRRLKIQMNNNIRSISIMADLYLAAYLINIKDDTAQLIKEKEENSIWKLEGDRVQSKINALLDNTCQELYLTEAKEFLDLSTVIARMKDASSISSEYFDEKIGWCALRIFNAGAVGGNAQIVLTIQDVNEEKKTLNAIEDRMNMAEYKQNVSGSFLETVSFALSSISAKVSADGKAIMQDAPQEDIKALADHIVMNTRHMTLIQNTMIDLYEIECKRLELNVHPYNLHESLEEVLHILKPFAEEKSFEFRFSVDEKIPAGLMGDSDRIEQILVILLFSSMLMTEKGFVQFSVFGKQQGDEEEMIFSIRDSAKGFSEEELRDIHEFINGSSIETFDNASLVYLKIINGILNQMGSELKIVSVLDEGTDFYFTIRQKIVE